MRTIFFATIVAGCTVFAGAQTVSAPNPKLNVLAESIRDDGSLVQLDGHVRIAACSIVTTDHATWHDNEFELGGRAHMKLTNGIDPLR
jgi:hypothetical protein